MCRYAEHMYKEHFACFGCRKSFKVTNCVQEEDKTVSGSVV